MMIKKSMPVLAILVLFFLSGTALPAGIQPVHPGPKDKCPVCGMFVAKYPDWVAEIIFPGGDVVFFDGAKDLFKYYFKMGKYDSQRSLEEIAAIFVTEYYDLKLIDAHKAFYVVGSNVYGPMGHELIPFASSADAKEFMKDHQGKKIVRFKEISPKLIAPLD